MATVRTPVVFIPGLWMHAESWRSWAELFRQAGFEPVVRSWPGARATVAETRAHPEGMVDKGITEIADHYAEIMRVLGARPIVIGHSFGGLIAQNLLGRGLAAEAIAIDPAPIKGVLPLPFSTLRSAFPVLKNPANNHRAIPLTAEEFRYGFGNAVSPEEAAELYERWAIPGPGRPLFQAAFANITPHSAAAVDTHNQARGPLLLIAGEKDHVVPPVVTRATLKQYRSSAAVTELEELPGRGHSLTIDHGWREVADTALAWLARHPVESARA
ncbi:MAG TPA: alpha/beta fold hydrolase [Anaeromyxobacteraceae bacterium]